MIQTTTENIQFSPISNIEEYNFHPVLKRFYGMGIQGLVRENLQNSIDGKLIRSQEPVIVNIKLGEMLKEDIPGINEIEDHIYSLEGRNTYTKETIEHMKKSLQPSEVRYISFEDQNTRGLTGAKNGQSSSKKDTFGIYAYNKGFHSEESDEALETARGGSHGIGKIASNAASDIHLMFFANCDEFGDQHLGGNVQLIEHSYRGSCYRATGYFSKVRDLANGQTRYMPFENNFSSVFKKTTRGLKIVIPFFRKEFDSETDIIKTICDNFFVAILNKNLIVNVNNHSLSADTIIKYVKDPNYYIQEIAQMKKEFTNLYVNTYQNREPRELKVDNGLDNYMFKLYFDYNEEIPKGRVAIFRTMGMKIEDFKVVNNASKPFNAVLIGGSKEDKYLKSLENESHTQISHESIDDPTLKSQARRFLSNLSKEIARIIDEEMKKNNPTDGFMDTADVLYTTELSFKEELKKSMRTVVINKDQSVIKTSVDSPSKKKTPESSKGKSTKKNPSDTAAKKGPIRKVGPSTESGSAKERYSVSPTIVERILLNDKEIVRFNFQGLSDLSDVKICDISFRIIDGKGEEYSFDLDKNFEKIVDQHTREEYLMDGLLLKDVKISNEAINLELKFKPMYNRSLKFIYYIEV